MVRLFVYLQLSSVLPKASSLHGRTYIYGLGGAYGHIKV